MTVVRARSAQAQRQNSESACNQLRGFTPVVEDWHAKLCFLEVLLCHGLHFV